MSKSNIPENLFYTKEHEWLKPIGDNLFKIGITDHAQSELGDIVYVELPEVGDEFSEGDSIGTIEAVKTVADIYIPVDAVIEEVNEELVDEASIMNESPYDDGWIAIIKVEDDMIMDDMMIPSQYKDFVG